MRERERETAREREKKKKTGRTHRKRGCLGTSTTESICIANVANRNKTHAQHTVIKTLLDSSEAGGGEPVSQTYFVYSTWLSLGTWSLARRYSDKWLRIRNAISRERRGSRETKTHTHTHKRQTGEGDTVQETRRAAGHSPLGAARWTAA